MKNSLLSRLFASLHRFARSAKPVLACFVWFMGIFLSAPHLAQAAPATGTTSFVDFPSFPIVGASPSPQTTSAVAGYKFTSVSTNRVAINVGTQGVNITAQAPSPVFAVYKGFSSDDGSNFKLNSFVFSAGTIVYQSPATLTMTAYSGGVAVPGSATTLTGPGTLNVPTTLDVSANTAYQNIDEVRITSTGNTNQGGTLRIGSITVQAAVTSTPASVTVPGGTTTLTATTSGTAGGSVSFNITGANLTGAPGNLTVTAPTNVQVSANNSTWGGTASIPYSTATLASTPVYVRLAGSGSVGTIAGNVSITGGGLASAVTQAVSGTLNPAPVAITSLSRVDATPSRAATVNWTLTFASAVTGLSASNFTLATPTPTGAAVGPPTIASGGGLTWTIPVSTGSTDGTLTLNLANATGLSSPISTALPFAGDSYAMDKTPPTVLSVTRLSPGTQTTNLTTVTFRVTYSEPVALNAPAASRFQVVPVNGSNIVGTVTGVTGVTGSGDIRDVTVNRTSGSGEFKLRVLD